MSQSTTSVLQALSHQWQPHLVCLTLSSAVALWILGRRLARSASPSRGTRLLYRLSIGLFILWLPLLGVAFLHVGCSASVSDQLKCQGNLKNLSLAMSLYIQDYDEQYPPATDWAGAIQRHVRSAEPFKCPSVQSGASYAMNAALSRRTTYELPDPMNTVLLFDAKAPAESFAGGKELLALERHGKVPNIAFTDGSVKRATPGYQQTFTWTPAWLPTKNKPRP